MDDVVAVRDGERGAYLRADLRYLARMDAATLLDGGLEVGAAHVLHDDVIRIAVATPIVDVDDVRAAQVCGRLGLLSEPRGEVGIGCVLREHHLDGDSPAKCRIGGLVNLSHAAHADFLGDLIAVAQCPINHVYTPCRL